MIYRLSPNLFPSLPLPMSSAALLGFVLVVGLLGGQLFRRVLKVPVTGFILTGVLLGPSGFDLLVPDILDSMRIFVDVSVGLILFETGRRVDFGWLRRERWLLSTGIAESMLSFLAMYFTLMWFGLNPLVAATGSAIGVCSSPAVLLLVSRDLRAEGQVTERALSLVAINSAFAFFLFTLSLSYLHMEHSSDLFTVVLHPLYLLVGSVTLGGAMSIVTLRLCSWLGRREELQFILLVGMMLLTTGIANQFKLPVLLTLLLLGLMSRNMDRRRFMTAVDFGPAGQLCFVVLFVYAGTQLVLVPIPAVLGIAAAYVGARFGAKSAAVLLLSRFSGLKARQSGALCFSLLPMSGVAIVMMQNAASLYPDFNDRLSTVILAAVAILDLIGPLAVRLSLELAGEAHPAVSAPKFACTRRSDETAGI
jgi:Kef-type K+ transport system membrane component KefB